MLGRTRKIFIVILVIAVLASAGIAYSAGRQSAFDGALDDVGLFEVTGELQTAKLFCSSSGCKWLWLIEVTGEAQPVEGFDVPKTALPRPESIITVEVPDSRANLFVSTQPIASHTSGGVSIEEHSVTQQAVTIVVAELLSDSSGLPEYTGVPK